tara:strand:- start:1121 stop:1333 length:213 start_codon:yes stop_codon:yes gene_type:complete
MFSLLASIGIGGTVGTILGVMADPVSNAVVTYSFKGLRRMSKGEHLSQDEKDWIRKYNEEKRKYPTFHWR